MYVYQIQCSVNYKATQVFDRIFKTKKGAEYALLQNNFDYSPEADIWHNGATEAWIKKIQVEI